MNKNKNLAIALSHQRMREIIDINQFANEMLTTYPRHIIQDFMFWADQNHNKEMFRYAWLEVFCYWRDQICLF